MKSQTMSCLSMKDQKVEVHRSECQGSDLVLRKSPLSRRRCIRLGIKFLALLEIKTSPPSRLRYLKSKPVSQPFLCSVKLTLLDFTRRSADSSVVSSNRTLLLAFPSGSTLAKQALNDKQLALPSQMLMLLLRMPLSCAA